MFWFLFGLLQAFGCGASSSTMEKLEKSVKDTVGKNAKLWDVHNR